MSEDFIDKYGDYDKINTSIFEHIPEPSFYNNNFYKGLKRKGEVKNDLLFAKGDDDNQIDWYILDGEDRIYIGYEFSDEGIINLSDKQFT